MNCIQCIQKAIQGFVTDLISLKYTQSDHRPIKLRLNQVLFKTILFFKTRQSINPFMASSTVLINIIHLDTLSQVQ